MKFLDKLNNILDKLQDDFKEVEDVSSITLDAVQLKAFEQTRDALKLVQTYLYAASAEPTEVIPIGHNKIFNEFAKNHSDMVQKWQELPEVPNDYATMYLQQIGQPQNLAWHPVIDEPPPPQRQLKLMLYYHDGRQSIFNFLCH